MQKLETVNLILTWLFFYNFSSIPFYDILSINR
jgi:hypothetical protein